MIFKRLKVNVYRKDLLKIIYSSLSSEKMQIRDIRQKRLLLELLNYLLNNIFNGKGDLTF